MGEGSMNNQQPGPDPTAADQGQVNCHERGGPPDRFAFSASPSCSPRGLRAEPGHRVSGRAYARWLALDWRERRLLLGLMIGLPMIAATLRLFGVFRTQRWLERLSNNAAARDLNSDALRSAERLAELAEIAGRRGPISVTCLRQALMVYWLLRRRGFAPELKIGMRSQDGVMDGHAWVELGGVALNQPNLSHVAFEGKRGTQ